MILEVAAIKEGGTPHRVKIFLSEDQLDLDKSGFSLHLNEPITGFCELTLLSGQRVRVKGAVETKLNIKCDRCLGQFFNPIKKSFDLLYVPDVTVAGTEEVNLNYDDLAVGFYKDGKIDVSRVVLEPIFIELPMKLICSPSCKGLCGQCGANLNEVECNCPSFSDTRWHGLAKFRKKLT